MVYRNRDPWFSDTAVHQAIADIAGSDRVTLYVGAGATIDRTGLGWADLIEKLLSEDDLAADQITKADAKLMGKVLEPMAAGSLAAHYFKQRYGASWETRLYQAMEGALYSGESWRSGILGTQVIRLALALKQVGKDVDIVTTNYNTFLEEEYLEQARLVPEDAEDFADLEVFALDEPVTTHQRGESKVGTIKLTYLHGRIAEGGGHQGAIALTELDYFRLREPVAKALRELFSDSPVLIMGASLTDPPLLAALQETNNDAGRRYALTPIMSYPAFSKLTDDDVEAAISHLTARMREFDVSLLFPDFFHQVPQFCQEVLVALKAGPDVSYADAAAIRYGHRLDAWWEEWEAHHMSGPDVERCYGRLTKIMRRIQARNDLCPVKDRRPKGDSDDRESELFKLEVWVRWKPGPRSRRLGLWSVSTGIRRDFESLRTPELNASSEYEAVQAFIKGAPQRRELARTADRELWQTALSVPLYYRADGVLLPVGVICLLGSKPPGESRVAVSDAAGMRKLVVQLQLCGEELIQPQLPDD